MFFARIDRLVLEEVVPWFFGAVLLFTSLFFAAGEMLRLAEFSGKGVPLQTIGRLILLTLPYIVALTFPMAMLLAALLGFGRLSSDSEIVALVAGGASFERIEFPVALFALLVSLVGFWFGDTVVPAANRMRERIYDRVQETATGRDVSAVGFSYPLRENKTGALTTLIQVEGGVNVVRGEMRNVAINFWHQGRQTGYVWARRATWKLGTRDWTLHDVEGASLAGENPVAWEAETTLTRDNHLLGPGGTITLGTPQELKQMELPVEQVGIGTLRERARLLREARDESGARAAEVEVARRIALPFASFIFALVGAPLGVRPQRAGKGVGFGLSILIIFAYWVTFQITLLLGRTGALPPALAAALPNLAGIAAAIWLNRRVLR